MPLSLRNAANFRNQDEFQVWNPASDTFSGGLAGRIRRADPSISPSHRHSRRDSLLLTPSPYTPTGSAVLRHKQSGGLFLLGQVPERDRLGDVFRETRRVHRVSPPSGGRGLYRSVTVAGTGDDLGFVTVSPGTTVYVDVEFAVAYSAPDTVNSRIGEYLVFCSENVSPIEGDYISFGSESFRAEQWFRDNGFLCARAVKLAPDFVPAVFSYPASGSPVYDPVTGRMSGGTPASREVSVLVGERSGDNSALDRVIEGLTLYVYTGHIGFSPALGMRVTLEDRTYRISKVYSRIENKQWKLEVAP